MLVALLVTAAVVAGCGRRDKRDRLGAELKAMAAELNAGCPVEIDLITRLDSCVAAGSDKFQYNYTVHIDQDDMDSGDIRELERSLGEAITVQVGTSPDMEYFRKNKVTLVYSYKDGTGRHMFDITVTPDMYGRK